MYDCVRIFAVYHSSVIPLFSNNRQGKVQESIEYLKQFVEVAEKSGQEQAYSKACHNLGNIYNSLVSMYFVLFEYTESYNLVEHLFYFVLVVPG